MSYVNEDKVFGFIILSVVLGIGSGLIAFHFSHDDSLGWGVGMVVGVVGVLVMIFIAKIAAIIDDLNYEGDDEDEVEEDD